jgi:transporter family-2 protein
MTLAIIYAVIAGIFVSLSRQLNGRLSLSTSPMMASFWNHFIGFVFLTALGLVIGGLWPEGASDAPWYVYVGGPIGVIFVASGSWLISRIGAVNTAILVIGGQMVFGVIFDILRGAPTVLWASALGVVLILAGMALTQRK